MRIISVSNNNTYNHSFGINLQSKKLRFKEDDFYVRIKGYGHHSGWAKKIRETADAVVNFIREKCNFEETLKKTCDGVTEANNLLIDSDKRLHTGILRTNREGWRFGSDWNAEDGIITKYGRGTNNSKSNKYKSYVDRFDYVVKHPLKNPYDDMILTRPVHDKDYYGKILDHGNGKSINKAFEHINKIYDDLYKKYISCEVKEENLKDINNSIAEIRWILAHATPWERGSDAISNTFIRAVYKAAGIKTYPLKRGVSLDLEAYCTNLEEYKTNFPKFFQYEPKIID